MDTHLDRVGLEGREVRLDRGPASRPEEKRVDERGVPCKHASDYVVTERWRVGTRRARQTRGKASAADVFLARNAWNSIPRDRAVWARIPRPFTVG